MDFSVLEHDFRGWTYQPFVSRQDDGTWEAGEINISYLNEHFGGLTREEILEKSKDIAGLKEYFRWLDKQGILT